MVRHEGTKGRRHEGWKRSRWRGGLTLRAFVPMCLCAFLAAPAFAVEVDNIMYQDPHLVTPEAEKVFSPRLKTLWLEAMAQPNADLQTQAALTIAEAHRRGMPNLRGTAGALAVMLDGPDTHPAARLAAARALVALDASDSAAVLLKRAGVDGLEMALTVEPALAAWDYAPARSTWLARVNDPRAPRALLLVAIRALGQVGEEGAAPRLRALALDREVEPGVRIEAARALGAVASDGLVLDAQRLARSAGPEGVTDRLVAAAMLATHTGADAEALLLELAADPSPAVAAIAIRRLLQIDPLLIEPIDRKLVASMDANVRRLAAEAVFAQRSPRAVGVLGSMLDDPHPDVRAYVRDVLLQLEREEEHLKDPVRDAAMDMLASDRWRGIEQAALILGHLDHEPAADRLIELLDFDRPEVFVTAAWALRMLALEWTLPVMHEKIERELAIMDQRTEGVESIEEMIQIKTAVDRQAAQLIQTFGSLNYTQADELLRRFVPKGSGLGVESRTAAVWALGHLHAGESRSDLVRAFSSRLSDINPMNPEAEPVRRLAAVGIGRMKGSGVLSTLQRFYKEELHSSQIGAACAWAIEQITGQPLPPEPPPKAEQTGWFLEPVE